ncbi:MAG: AAA family ATPase, partial [Vulcanimicrobiota bacterium]
MLLELKIENFALVEDMEMVFNPGFNILTGESGSGKSLIVESLNFVLGARVKSSRFDSDETVRVQAVFDISGLEQELLDQLKNYDITGEADQVLVLNRKLYSSGRSVYQINGEIVPYSNFKEIGFQLVDIHGQRDNQYLFDLNNQRKLVDLAAGKEAKVLLERIQQIYSEYKNLEREIQVLKEQEKDRNRRIDWLEHEINEIASAQLVVGEDEELEQTRKILSNREKIAELCNSIHEKLSSESGVIEKLNRVSRELEQLVSLDTSLDISSDLIDVALNNIQEIIFTVRDKAESLETGGANLDEVISRLNLIDNLKKKYGNSIEEILGYLEESRKKLETLSRSQQVIEDLLGRKTEQEKEWLWTAESLSVLRKKAAK